MAVVDPSYRLLACQYLRKQLDALIKEVHGVRENRDIEPVHQARVASRRMRAALGMFADCFGAKQTAKWQKRIKRVTKGLGAARDLDVQVEFLSQFLSHLDEKDKKHRPGVQRLLLRLCQDRDTLQPAVLKTLDALEKGNAMAEMHGELEKTLFMLRNRAVDLQSPFVFERTAMHIRQCQRALLANEHSLADSENIAGHHQLRIDAKKLRYTMEICDPAYDKKLAPAIKAVKKTQSLLGDIHDCDVWVENVTTFMEQERVRTIDYFGHHGPFNRLKPGLELLVEERKKCRKETFSALLEHWRTLDENRFWDDLEAMLQSPLEGVPEGVDQIEDRPAHGAEEETNNDRPDQ
jgi:CHAD domain-containing protein